MLSQERLEGAGPSGAWKFPLTALAPTSLARSRNDLTLFFVREAVLGHPRLTASLKLCYRLFQREQCGS